MTPPEASPPDVDQGRIHHQGSGNLYALALTAGFFAFLLAGRPHAVMAFAVTFLTVMSLGVLVIAMAVWLDVRRGLSAHVSAKNRREASRDV